MITHHDQVGFGSAMMGRFNMWKSVNVIGHIVALRMKAYTISNRYRKSLGKHPPFLV